MGRPKKAAQAAPIAENRHVKELLSVMEANNMPGAKDLLAVIGQVGAMENHLADMVKELATLRRELAEAQRQNHPIKTALQKAVIVLQAQVLELRDNLAGLKRDIIDGCKNALEAFHEKGLSALRNLADFFKLRPGLEAIRENIDRGISENSAAIARIEAVSNEAHQAGRHIANIGRTMAGKEPIPDAKPPGKLTYALTAPLRADRALLAAMRGNVDKAIGAVKRLEKAERKPPIMETIKKLDAEIQQAQKDAPVRDRQRPAPDHADR